MGQKSVEDRLNSMRNWLIGLTAVTAIAIAIDIIDPFKGDKDEPVERVYDQMTLTGDQLRKALIREDGGDPNEIKLIYYTWVETNGKWALQAFGADSKGNRLSLPVPLRIDDPGAYSTLKDLERAPMGNTRGQLKYMLGSANVGRDVVIEDSVIRDIRFTSALREVEPGIGYMFYETRGANPSMINPAPPFTFACIDCDDR